MPTATLTSAAPAAQVVELELPQGLEFKIESVVAQINAGGAGDVRPELAIVDPSGATIATKRLASPIPAGGAGLATWALGLDEAAPASAGPSFTALTEYFDDPFFLGTTVPAGNAADLAWNNPTGDVLLDLTNPTAPLILATGLYAISATVYPKDDTLGFVVGLPLGFGVGDVTIGTPLPAGVQTSMTWATAGPTVMSMTVALVRPFAAGDTLKAVGVSSQPANARFTFSAVVVRLG